MPNAVDSEPPDTPRSKVASWIFLRRVIAMLIAVAIASVAFFPSWAPVVVFAVTWILSAFLFSSDKAPYESSRVAVALLTAWAADAILYRLAVLHLTTTFRSLVPGIIVASVFCGYIAWTAAGRHIERASRERHDEEATNSLTGVGSLGLAAFLLLSVLSPIMRDYLPALLAQSVLVFEHGLTGDDRARYRSPEF